MSARRPTIIRKRADDGGHLVDAATEALVLGRFLQDEAMFDPAALSIVDLAVHGYQLIYRRMLELRELGEAVNAPTVANALTVNAELESAGGYGVLAELLKTPRLADISSYIALLKEKSAQRAALAIMEHGAARLALGDKAADVIGTAQDQLAAIILKSVRSMQVEDVRPISEFEAQKIEMVLARMIAVGTMLLISAEPGSGKSTLILAICNAIAKGKDFAGMATLQRPVLYLDRENPLSVVAERFERLGITDDPNFHYWGGWEHSEPPGPGSPVVLGWVARCAVPPVIVFDSLAGFYAGDENDASVMRQFTQGLRRLADKGVTVILLHHPGKSEGAKDYRGSSDLKASVDIAYHLVNLGDTQLKDLRLRAFKARFSVESEIILHYYDGEFTSDSRTPKQTVTEALEYLLRQNPLVGTSDFEELAFKKDLSRTKARAFLSDGVKRGVVSMTPGPHGARFYTWAEDAKQCEL